MFGNLAFLSAFLYPSAVFMASIVCLFLFFRGMRRELFEKELIFDFVLLGLFFALISGRVFDFVIRPDFYSWSFKKLFFFNVFGGFDIWGAMIGFLIFGFLFLKRRVHQKIWQILDICMPALALSASIVSLSLYLDHRKIIFLYYFIGYFIIFWALKRLEKIKKHQGFFISFFMVAVSLLNLALFDLRDLSRHLFLGIAYGLVLPLSFLIVFVPLWYVLAKRKPKEDIKSLVAVFVLAILKLRRVLFSLTEANNLAKLIVLSPYFLFKSAYFLVLLLGREIYQSFLDFKSALGIRK